MSQEHQTPSPETASSAAVADDGQIRRSRLPQRQQFIFRRRVQTRRRDHHQPQAVGRILRTDRKRTVATLRRKPGTTVVGGGPRHLRRRRPRARFVHTPVAREAAGVREEKVRQGHQGGPQDQEIPEDTQS